MSHHAAKLIGGTVLAMACSSCEPPWSDEFVAGRIASGNAARFLREARHCGVGNIRLVADRDRAGLTEVLVTEDGTLNGGAIDCVEAVVAHHLSRSAA